MTTDKYLVDEPLFMVEYVAVVNQKLGEERYDKMEEIVSDLEEHSKQNRNDALIDGMGSASSLGGGIGIETYSESLPEYIDIASSNEMGAAGLALGITAGIVLGLRSYHAKNQMSKSDEILRRIEEKEYEGLAEETADILG